jgi:hypothetical protein
MWSSSWDWGYYPSYWHPWHPLYWHYYYGYHYNWHPQYYGHYRQGHQNRYQGYNDFYYRDIRSHSAYVSARIKEGHYKSTYSHPEQRRDGEALYSEMYPDRNTRTQDNSVDRNLERRSVTQQKQGKTLSGERSVNTRRSINNSVDRVVAKPEKNQNSVISRRTLDNNSERAVSKSEQSQNAGTSRKSTSSDSYRAVARPEQVKSNGTSRRSPATISERVVSKPPQGLKAENSNRQSTMNTGSSERRINKVSKPETTLVRSDNARGAEAGKTSRRK